MPRDGSGNFSLPANTLAVSGDPISSTKFNTLVQDLESDANTDRPITAGGTGASTAAGALTNLFSGASPGGADKIAFWDQSATSFGWLSLGTGLTFSGTTLALDADLVTLAGLTPTANNFIVGNAGGTAWEVKTPADSRTALGLGTAAVVNTGTSGGTVPLLNGTNTFSATQSFAGADPLVLNTSVVALRRIRFQTSGVDRWYVGANSAAEDGGNAGTDFQILARTDAGGAVGTALTITRATMAANWGGTLSVQSNTVWHAGNDGAGSGLDADTLDGVQGSAFAQLSGAAFTGVISITNASQTPISISRTGSSGGVGIQYVNTEGSFSIFGAPTGSGTGVLLPSTDNQIDLGTTVNSWRNGVFDGIVFANTIELGSASDTTLSRASAGQILVEGVQVVTVSNTVTLTNKTLAAPVISTISNTGTLTLPTSTDTLVGRATTDTLTNKTLTNPTINGGALSGTLSGTPTFSGGVTLTTPTINGGTIQSRPQAASETTGTLTAASANKTIQATGDITIDNSVFAAGDIILIYAGASARTITQGSGVTMRLGGSATTGSRTLAARGVAMLFFVSASEVVVSGSGVT